MEGLSQRPNNLAPTRDMPFQSARVVARRKGEQKGAAPYLFPQPTAGVQESQGQGSASEGTEQGGESEGDSRSSGSSSRSSYHATQARGSKGRQYGKTGAGAGAKASASASNAQGSAGRGFTAGRQAAAGGGAAASAAVAAAVGRRREGEGREGAEAEEVDGLLVGPTQEGPLALYPDFSIVDQRRKWQRIKDWAAQDSTVAATSAPPLPATAAPSVLHDDAHSVDSTLLELELERARTSMQAAQFGAHAAAAVAQAQAMQQQQQQQRAKTSTGGDATGFAKGVASSGAVTAGAVTAAAGSGAAKDSTSTHMPGLEAAAETAGGAPSLQQALLGLASDKAASLTMGQGLATAAHATAVTAGLHASALRGQPDLDAVLSLLAAQEPGAGAVVVRAVPAAVTGPAVAAVTAAGAAKDAAPGQAAAQGKARPQPAAALELAEVGAAGSQVKKWR